MCILIHLAVLPSSPRHRGDSVAPVSMNSYPLKLSSEAIPSRSGIDLFTSRIHSTTESTKSPPTSPRVSEESNTGTPQDDLDPFSPFINKVTKIVETKKKVFVLSLDGGGIRCIMQTIIIKRLLSVFPDLLRYTRWLP